VILALGKIAWDASPGAGRPTWMRAPEPRVAFGHGAVLPLAPQLSLIGSYHVSQQNTFYGNFDERDVRRGAGAMQGGRGLGVGGVLVIARGSGHTTLAKDENRRSTDRRRIFPRHLSSPIAVWRGSCPLSFGVGALFLVTFFQDHRHVPKRLPSNEIMRGVVLLPGPLTLIVWSTYRLLAGKFRSVKVDAEGVECRAMFPASDVFGVGRRSVGAAAAWRSHPARRRHPCYHSLARAWNHQHRANGPPPTWVIAQQARHECTPRSSARRSHPPFG